MDKELSLFCAIFDLKIEEDLSGFTPTVKIICMTITQFSTNMHFSRDNDFKTLTTSSKLMGSHLRLLEVVKALK